MVPPGQRAPSRIDIELIRPFKRLSGSSFEDDGNCVSSIALSRRIRREVYSLEHPVFLARRPVCITFALLFGLNLFSLIISGLNAASGYIFAYFFYHTFIVLRKALPYLRFGMICRIAMMLMAASSLINPFGFGFVLRRPSPTPSSRFTRGSVQLAMRKTRGRLIAGAAAA